VPAYSNFKIRQLRAVCVRLGLTGCDRTSHGAAEDAASTAEACRDFRFSDLAGQGSEHVKFKQEKTLWQRAW
jgi:hypothetical protein